MDPEEEDDLESNMQIKKNTRRYTTPFKADQYTKETRVRSRLDKLLEDIAD